jgi:hypothetical protein
LSASSRCDQFTLTLLQQSVRAICSIAALKIFLPSFLSSFALAAQLEILVSAPIGFELTAFLKRASTLLFISLVDTQAKAKA